MGSKSRYFGRQSLEEPAFAVHYSVLGFYNPVDGAELPEVTYTFDLEMAEAFFDDDRGNDEIGAGSWYETQTQLLDTREQRVVLMEKFGALDSCWIPPLTGEARLLVSRGKD